MEAKRGLKYKGTGDVTAAAEEKAAAPPAPSGAPAPPGPPPPMPPPPTPAPVGATAKKSGGGMAALFADLRKVGERQEKTGSSGMRKVRKDQKNKNKKISGKLDLDKLPKKKTKKATKSAAPKKVYPPTQYFATGEGTHYVEHQPADVRLTVEASAKEKVYLYKCAGAIVTIKGKFKCLSLVNCKKTQVIFDDMISVAEVNNCTSVKLQALGQCPSVCIDKTDGCIVYLSAKSLDCQFVCSKISECNVSWPDPDSADKENPDWVDKPIPEQYHHSIDVENKAVTARVSDLYSEQ